MEAEFTDEWVEEGRRSARRPGLSAWAPEASHAVARRTSGYICSPRSKGRRRSRGNQEASLVTLSGISEEAWLST